MRITQLRKDTELKVLDAPVLECFATLFNPAAADIFINKVYPGYLEKYIQSTDKSPFDWSGVEVRAISLNSKLIIAGIPSEKTVCLINTGNYYQEETSLFNASIAVYVLALVHYLEQMISMHSLAGKELDVAKNNPNDFLISEVERRKEVYEKFGELVCNIYDQYNATREALSQFPHLSTIIDGFTD